MPVRDYSSEPDQDKEVDIESQLSPLDSRNSTLHITNGREYRNSLVGPSYIDNHRTVSGPATRFESTEKESNEISDKKESAVHLEETRSSESHPPRRWQQRPNFRWPARWRITWTRAHYVLTSGIFIGFIVMLVLYLIEKHSTRKAPIVSSNDIVATNFTQPSNPNNTTISSILLQPVDVPPLLDTSLGATVIRFGKLLSNTTSEDQTILVYNGPNGKLCIRWKTGNSFRNNVQCELQVSLHSIQSTILPITISLCTKLSRPNWGNFVPFCRLNCLRYCDTMQVKRTTLGSPPHSVVMNLVFF